MRVRGLVAGVSALAVLAVGCGDGSDDATEEVSTVTLDLLGDTVEGGTVRFEMAMDDLPWVPGPDGTASRASADAAGVVDLEGGDSDMTATIRVEPPPVEASIDPILTPRDTSFQVREVGDRRFGRQWLEGSGDDAPWVEETGDLDGDGEDDDGLTFEDGGDDSLLGDLFDLRGFDPEGALEALRAATDQVTEEGRDEVRGEPTTRYRAIVDGDDLGDEVEADDREPLDVWIDDDGRLRRVEVAGMSLDLFDYGVPVEIEVPTDIGSSEDAESWFGWEQPTAVGEWQVQAEGATAGGTSWTVFAAPHELDGAAFTCRTIELGDAEGGLAGLPEGFDVDAFMPNHDGVPATCGYSSWFGTPTTNDPSVQVLRSEAWGPAAPSESVLAFAVDDRWRDGQVRLVRDGVDDVVLDVDPSGLALWVAEGSAPLAEVWVGDDAVRCDVVDFDEVIDDAGEAMEDEGVDIPDEALPDEVTWLAPIYVGSCVRP